MKSINPAMLAHLASEVTTLATIFKLTRADGVVMGFTDHDRDITVGSVTYKAAIGYTCSALGTALGETLRRKRAYVPWHPLHSPS